MVDVFKWPIPPADLRIEPREVHVWRATEPDHAASLDGLFSILSADERTRAGGFHFDSDRRRYIFCRGALRQLLGRYTGQPAGAIEFSFGQYGKPALAGSQSLHFNLSHTRGLCLLAFSATLPVGIDVEVIEPGRDWNMTARHFFHPGEWALLESQPDSTRSRTGYTIWTSKEAWLKACGDGIGGGLESFEVIPPASAGGEVRIELPKGSIAGGAFLRSLDVGPDYAAALASIGQLAGIRTWNWQSD